MDSPIPPFSAAERAARFARVRAAMRAEGLDCLLAVAVEGLFTEARANVKYLTDVGQNLTEAAAVFPAEGEPVCFVADAARAAWWAANQSWTSDVRACGGRWGAAMGEQVRALGLERGRIGVASLTRSLRAPEGLVAAGTAEALRAALPHAELVEAAPLLEEVRAIKSTEEIVCLERAGAMAERALAAQFEAARAGVPECEVYGRVVAAAVGQGADFPPMLLWRAGPRTGRTNTFATPRPLAAGDIIINDMVVRCHGYGAKVAHPMMVGPTSPDFRRTFGAVRAVFEATLAALRPGLAYSAVQEGAAAAAHEQGVALDGMIARGLGLGEDIPLPGRHDRVSDDLLPLAAGMVLSLQPAVSDPASGLHLGLADTVVLTATGAARLGSRPLALVE